MQKVHREVVKVTYYLEQVTCRQLLYLTKHIDPTDGEGSFVDNVFNASRILKMVAH
jgi:peptide methionine sulfoxide reductase MsrA